MAFDPNRLPEEFMHERRRRFALQPFRRIHLLDPPGPHHRDSIGYLHRLCLIVRDE
jgi:hypothetical protein